MDLRRAGISNHLRNLLQRGTTYDAVINQSNALALQNRAVRVVFKLENQVAELVRRLDNCPYIRVVGFGAEVARAAQLLGV